jgi:hypothetical protein
LTLTGDRPGSVQLPRQAAPVSQPNNRTDGTSDVGRHVPLAVQDVNTPMQEERVTAWSNVEPHGDSLHIDPDGTSTAASPISLGAIASAVANVA